MASYLIYLYSICVSGSNCREVLAIEHLFANIFHHSGFVHFCMFSPLENGKSHANVPPLADDSSFRPVRSHPHGAEWRTRSIGVRLSGNIVTIHAPVRPETSSISLFDCKANFGSLYDTVSCFPLRCPCPVRTLERYIREAMQTRLKEIQPEPEKIESAVKLISRVTFVLEHLKTSSIDDLCKIDTITCVGSFPMGTMIRGHCSGDLVVVLKTLPIRTAIRALGNRILDELTKPDRDGSFDNFDMR